jgi:hypothetical protein
LHGQKKLAESKKINNYFLEAATCKKIEKKQIQPISHFQQFILFFMVNSLVHGFQGE